MALFKDVFICKNPFRSLLRKKVATLAKPVRKKPAPTSLSFDFNKVARQALHDHPELKKDILFVDAENDNYLASSSTLTHLDDDDDAQDELAKTVRHAKRLRTSFAQSIMIDDTKTIHAVVFHPDRHTLFDPHNRAIDSIGTMDHELGHLLSPNAERTHGENVADAYAILRHLQRFDGQQTQADYAAWKRAMVFISGGYTSHLTTFTLDKILLDRTSANFVSLTPAQTVAIARDYARKHTPSQDRLSKLSADFHSARSKTINQNFFREVARITLAADTSTDTFYLGARALMPVLGASHMTLNGKNIILRGPEWARLHAQLARKIETLPAQHPLRRTQGLRGPQTAHNL